MPWGGPTEQQDQTLWMCYIATDVLEPNLALLRQNTYFIQYLDLVKCTLQLTKLHESISRVVYHAAYKDPLHTNKNELEARIQDHINTHHPSRPLPIHLINIDAKFKNGDKTDVVRMCTVVVGTRDVTAVVKTLTRVPFEPLVLEVLAMSSYVQVVIIIIWCNIHTGCTFDPGATTSSN